VAAQALLHLGPDTAMVTDVLLEHVLLHLPACSCVSCSLYSVTPAGRAPRLIRVGYPDAQRQWALIQRHSCCRRHSCYFPIMFRRAIFLFQHTTFAVLFRAPTQERVLNSRAQNLIQEHIQTHTRTYRHIQIYTLLQTHICK